MSENSQYRIEIPIELKDQTSQGARGVEQSLAGVGRAATQSQGVLSGLSGRNWNVTVGIADRVSSAIGNIARSITSLTGKTWQLTLQVRDFATAPLKAVGGLITGIVQTLTNPWALLGTFGLGIVGQQAVSHGLLAPLNLYDTRKQAELGLTATNASRGMAPAQASAAANDFITQSTAFGFKKTTFDENKSRDWATQMYVQGFSPDQILGTGSNNQGSYLKSISDFVSMRKGFGAEGQLGISSVVQTFSDVQRNKRISGDDLSNLGEYMPVWDILSKAYSKEKGYDVNPLMLRSLAADYRLPYDKTLRFLAEGGEAGAKDFQANSASQTTTGLMSQLGGRFRQTLMMPFGEGESGPVNDFLTGVLAKFDTYEADGTLGRITQGLKDMGKSIADFGTGIAQTGINAIDSLFKDPQFQNAPDLMGKLQVAWNKLDIGGTIGKGAAGVWDWLGSTLNSWIKDHGDDVRSAASGLGAGLGSALNSGVMAILGIGGTAAGAPEGGDTWSTAGHDAGVNFFGAFAKEFDAGQLAGKLVEKVATANKDSAGNIISGNGGPGDVMTPVVTIAAGTAALVTVIGLIAKVTGAWATVAGWFPGAATTVATGVESAGAVIPTAAAIPAAATGVEAGAAGWALPGASAGGTGLGSIAAFLGPVVGVGVAAGLAYLLINQDDQTKERGIRDTAIKTGDWSVYQGSQNAYDWEARTAQTDATTRTRTFADRIGDAISALGSWTSQLLQVGRGSSAGGGAAGRAPGSKLTDPQTAEALLAAGWDPAQVGYICGPLAVQGILRAAGKNVSLGDVVKAATPGGYGPNGMGGVGNFQATLKSFGVDSKIGTLADAAAQLQAGGAISISTNNHWFDANGVDEQGRWFVGNSGTALKGGKEWMTPTEINAAGGGATTYVLPIGVAASGVGMSGSGGPIDTSSHQAFINSISSVSALASARTGLPPEFFDTMAAHEGGWGVGHENDFNFWGMKATPGQPSVMKSSWEDLNKNGVEDPGERSQMAFRKYASAGESINAFASTITDPNGRYSAPYQQFLKDHDLGALYAGMQKAGYASDTAWGSKMSAFGLNEISPLLGGRGPGSAIAEPDAAVSAGTTGDGITIQQINLNIGAGADEEQGKSAAAAFISTLTAAVKNARENR